MTSQFYQVSEELISFEKPQKPHESEWFILYTCPRAEKVVYHELVRRDYDAFLPMTKTLKVWRNRQKKLIDEVLFPGYIFVNSHPCDLSYLVKIPKVVTYIQYAGNPSVIHFRKIEGIRKMLNLEQEVSVETELYEGEKVTMVYGPMAGYEGILIKHNGRTRFGIQLKEINRSVCIDIWTNNPEKVL